MKIGFPFVKHSRLYSFFSRIWIVLILFTLSYSLGNVDLIFALFWRIGSRALLCKLGFPGGALLMAFFFRVLLTEGTEEIGVVPLRMMPTGSDEGGNTDSGSWQKYLHLSGEGTENSTAEPASRTRSSDPREDIGPSSVRRRVDAPETSTSSGWSGSWIERWFNQEETSSAPGDGQQPQGEVDQPTANAMGEEAPDPTWLKIHIERVFYIIKGRKPHNRVLAELYDDFKLETASPRLQIEPILDQMQLDKRFKGSDFRLDQEFGVRIYDWERDQ